MRRSSRSGLRGVCALLVLGLGVHGYGQTLSLSEYLTQVKERNLGFKSSLKKLSASQNRREEASIIFGPQMFANATHAKDQRKNWQVTIPMTGTVINDYSFGVQEQMRFGLQTKVSYDLQKVEIQGAPPSMVPISSFNTGAFSVELNQPLWKNAFGSEARIQEQQGIKGIEAKGYIEQYTARMILLAAERAYWQFAVSCEQIKIAEETYDRTRKLMEWQQKRADSNLSDQSDLLQAKAALKGRQVELAAAINANRLALKEFNDFREEKSDKKVVTKLPTDSHTLLKMEIPRRANEREDIKAQRLALAAKESSLSLERRRYDAEFDLFAKGMLTKVAEKTNEALSGSFGKSEPMFAFGVNFTMPLSAGIIDRARMGYLEELEGEKLALEQKIRDADNEWVEFTQKFKDAKETLLLLSELESLQKEHFQAERDRATQGRSTTGQIFVAEQDYLNAQNSRLQGVAQVLVLLTVLKSHQDGAL